MAKRSVRIDIPTRYPDKYTKLLDEVSKKHISLGASSPLHNSTVVDMADFEAKKNQAIALRKEAQQHYAKAQALMEDARVLLGTNAGQTVYTKGTLYYMLDIIKRVLQTNFMGQEESLSEWGFNVVVKLANVGRKPKK